MASRSIVALGACLLLGACADGGVASGPSGQVAIEVGALSLDGITGATYTITVANAVGPVWSRTLSSGQFGDGQGGLSYVGPCDATAELAEHTIALELVELRDSRGAMTDGVDFTNPAPVGDPVFARARCLPNADAPVVFDLVIARAAEQGFFDVAVEFDDIFCSAKLDCERSPGVPLELLTDSLGARSLTAVVGFTCTAGDDADTWLWMDRLVVTCEGGGPFIVDVADGPGHLDPVFDDPTSDLLFQAAIYRGIAHEGGAETAYWNAALGLNAAAFATLGDCTLTGTATATDGPLEDGVTPDGVRYPIVMWNVPLIEDGVRVCTTHKLDTGNGVATGYSPVTGHGFHAGFEQSSGLVTVTGAAPDNTSNLACAAAELEVGESTSCTLEARQAGQANWHGVRQLPGLGQRRHPVRAQPGLRDELHLPVHGDHLGRRRHRLGRLGRRPDGLADGGRRARRRAAHLRRSRARGQWHDDLHPHPDPRRFAHHRPRERPHRHVLGRHHLGPVSVHRHELHLHLHRPRDHRLHDRQHARSDGGTHGLRHTRLDDTLVYQHDPRVERFHDLHPHPDPRRFAHHRPRERPHRHDFGRHHLGPLTLYRHELHLHLHRPRDVTAHLAHRPLR